MKQLLKPTVKDIALIGVMTAVIEVSKIALSFLPNVELVTFWIIMFTLFLGPKVLYSILIFILIECTHYGLQTWVIMYLYIWPSLALLTWIVRKHASIWFFAILSALYGLFFGALCAIPYIAIGAVDGGLIHGLYAGFTWWIAGIPYDILHGVSNFILMLVLYHPVSQVMKRISKVVME